MKAYPVIFYRNLLGQWRWKIKATNGKTIASSSESFWNKSDCEYNAGLTEKSLTDHFNSIHSFTYKTNSTDPRNGNYELL